MTDTSSSAEDKPITLPWIDAAPFSDGDDLECRGVDVLTGNRIGTAVHLTGMKADLVPFDRELSRDPDRFWVDAPVVALSEALSYWEPDALSLVSELQPIDMSQHDIVRIFRHSSHQTCVSVLVHEFRSSPSLEPDATRDDFAMTASARELALADPEEFRKQYGDYFVSDCFRGAGFTCVMTWDCTRPPLRNRFAERLQTRLRDARRDGLLDGRYYPDADVDIVPTVNFRLFGLGDVSQSTRPKPPMCMADIDAHKDWFFRNAQGAPYATVLRHYSTVLEPRVPVNSEKYLQGPYSAAAGSEIANLRDTLLGCHVVWNGLPPLATGLDVVVELQRRLSHLSTACTASELHLVVDNARRRELLQDSTTLLKDLQTFERYYSLWRLATFCRIREATAPNPAERFPVDEAYEEWYRGERPAMWSSNTEKYWYTISTSERVPVVTVLAPETDTHDVPSAIVLHPVDSRDEHATETATHDAPLTVDFRPDDCDEGIPAVSAPETDTHDVPSAVVLHLVDSRDEPAHETATHEHDAPLDVDLRPEDCDKSIPAVSALEIQTDTRDVLLAVDLQPVDSRDDHVPATDTHEHDAPLDVDLHPADCDGHIPAVSAPETDTHDVRLAINLRPNDWVIGWRVAASARHPGLKPSASWVRDSPFFGSRTPAILVRPDQKVLPPVEGESKMQYYGDTEWTFTLFVIAQNEIIRMLDNMDEDTQANHVKAFKLPLTKVMNPE
ncbi:hypothetical protein EXIGLDRAFT_839029 [Exidia glandulosa HHB12029]|uniref:Uncharacterized protein n=1 Tax=Exidia glandulosa HHB12029 TaxID=1314781 RepID=A0A165FB26_EXIGL|nr:hypothetical protein EXIGLDRAFT_839029 [Exidia glandulosa HHB12029]